MSKTSKRTDCHRPGAIVPSDYEHRLSYRTPGSEPWDHYCMPEARAMCEAIGWGKGTHRMFGHIGQCGICGARYREGEIWAHVLTGDLVHVGCDCAAKYEMLADREDFVAALESLKKRRAAFIQAKLNEEAREAFMAQHPGLAEVLEGDHEILKDMAWKLKKYHSLSPKQVAFAFKLAAELKEKASRPVEVNVPAPTGKVTVRGILVSKKSHETPYGNVLKMTVKVTTEAGVWLAWGTMPDSISCGNGSRTVYDDGSSYESDGYVPRAEVGDEIEFTATLTQGRDAHFAMFKRPTKARIVTLKDPRRASTGPTPIDAPRAPSDSDKLFDALEAIDTAKSEGRPAWPLIKKVLDMKEMAS